ncbi:MAG TPA: prepilin-type N-terminal cleavage/methylation domain-containing protein [Nitrospiria bacterium]|nr:prepilin-type N-terminal cleavage/methylation domain-containing protein [Nitrospiria bacterium]
MDKNRVQNEGFTLPEVLAALVILMVGALVSAGMLINAIDGLRYGTQMTQALSSAQEKMETLREGGRWRRKDGEDWQGAINRRWSIERDPASFGKIYLVVKVSWRDRLGFSRELILSSIFFDPL